ncbi:MAG: aminotransferase, class [Xanthomonadaceae bacterium]|nr:aminotransferase, class [Xanthomonadaceae bacterium]
MSVLVFEGSTRIDAIPSDCRAVAYGDGLFETMRVSRGVVPWWDAHWSRLASGAQRLGLQLPDPGHVRAQASVLFEDGCDGVLKLLLSRGGKGRGYALSRNAAPVWIVSRHPLPDPISRGMHLHWCRTRVAIQPALAGLKHCNRLEQVLARGECDQANADEGLMCDTEGLVVGATAANIFVLHGEQWSTPLVDRCGIAGVCRDRLLSLLAAREERLSPAQVEDADAVFLCNAVRGILPVAQLGARTWCNRSATNACQRLLARSHPALAFDLELP